jgi:hypothetical protein
MRRLDARSLLPSSSRIRQFCASEARLRPLIGVIACGAIEAPPGAQLVLALACHSITVGLESVRDPARVRCDHARAVERCPVAPVALTSGSARS